MNLLNRIDRGYLWATPGSYNVHFIVKALSGLHVLCRFFLVYDKAKQSRTHTVYWSAHLFVIESQGTWYMYIKAMTDLEALSS